MVTVKVGLKTYGVSCFC